MTLISSGLINFEIQRARWDLIVAHTRFESSQVERLPPQSLLSIGRQLDPAELINYRQVFWLQTVVRRERGVLFYLSMVPLFSKSAGSLIMIGTYLDLEVRR